MAPRDPTKTARNRLIKQMKEQLREALPTVLHETGYESEASLNAKIGGKAGEFINLRDEVIHSPDHYRALYLKGFKAQLGNRRAESSYHDLYDRIQRSRAAKEYLNLFLKRSYLKHIDELYRLRPPVDEAEIWIGQNRAHYGLLVPPRFRANRWENDKSEIRHFPRLYWTIGHVLLTGLVIPDREEVMNFDSVDSYLKFFRNVIVRTSGSEYEERIAAAYSKFVRTSDDPLRVPLLIPEYRYDGLKAAHKYRLDFTIIDPFTLQKVGFELSPWSSHGYLKRTRELSQKQINATASGNFEREMTKHKEFFRKHRIFALIYTDKDLRDIDDLFDSIREYLEPIETNTQLDFNVMENFFNPKRTR